jgi:sugar/nucleoside kinase (ribokinase family)
MKVIGIGNALVDVLIRLDDESLLKELGFPKGSMQLVDAETSKLIAEKTKKYNKEMASGGSAANTIHGLARLGVETAFIGVVGRDKTGKFFEDDMKKSGIKPFLFKSDSPSGIATAMITKDGERTFGTFLGAAVELSAGMITKELFEGYDILHIEGYLVQNHQLIEKALKLAKDNGMKVSLDLASFNVVEENLDFLKEMVKRYVDILFANEEEAKAFTGLAPENALIELARISEISIVKVGSKGSMIKQGDTVVNIEPVKANPIDTTGAGDIYASGFLWGYVNNLGFEKAGYAGSLLAATVIEVIGAKFDNEKWDEIKKRLV